MFTLVAAPTVEPVSVAEACEHLRLEEKDDAYVQAILLAARQYVEAYTERALVTQTWDLFLDDWPADNGPITLGKGKCQSVTYVHYLDYTTGVETTLDPSQYQVDTASTPGRILVAKDCEWPACDTERLWPVRVRFVAGYGNADTVPQPVKAAMLLLVGHLYEHRESEVIGTITSTLHLAIDALLSPYKVHWEWK